jgi:hypothetical protein
VKIGEGSVTENWKSRNKSSRTSKRRRFSWQYSSKFFHVTDPTLKPKHGVGVLKNGHLLSACSIRGIRYLFSNTCAIDSVIQALAAVYVDFKYFASNAMSEGSRFFNLVKAVGDRITTSTYALRGQLLLDSGLTSTTTINKLQQVMCQVTATNMLQALDRGATKLNNVVETRSCSSMCCPLGGQREVSKWIKTVTVPASECVGALQYLLPESFETRRAPCKAPFIGETDEKQQLQLTTQLSLAIAYATAKLLL